MIKEMFVNENFWSNLADNALFIAELFGVIALVLVLSSNYLSKKFLKNGLW